MINYVNNSFDKVLKHADANQRTDYRLHSLQLLNS